MKNTRKVLGIIALAAVIGFAILSCGGDVAKVLVGVSITKPPAKIVYAIDEPFDKTGMEVTAAYTDATTAVVTDYTVNGFDSSREGVCRITVTYKDVTSPSAAALPVTVLSNNVEVADLSSIAITTLPTKVRYDIGEELDTAGMVITATYNDGTTSPVLVFFIAGFDSTTAGNKTVTVTYINKSTTFNVNVIDPDKETVAKPTAQPAAGTVYGSQSITLATTTTGATIYYTVDGTEPTTTSTAYSDPIEITPTAAVIIKAFAVKDGMNDSDVLTAAYNVQPVLTATPTASLAAGTYLTPQTVTLSSTTEDAEIYYTLDGTTPTTTSTQYTTAITISSTTTLKAIAVKEGYTNSGVLTAVYNFSYIPLTADTWAEGTSASGATNDKWFRFTATATTTYIHFQPGTSSGSYVQLYEADGTTTLGTQSTFSSSTISVNRTTVVGNSYYIKVSYNYNSGTYKIGFNDQTLPPPVTIPSAVTALTADTWADGNIPASGGEQWFKFTATATNHYIHFYTGTLSSVYVQRYDAEGRLISGTGTGTSLSGTTLYVNQTSLTSESVYYVKVTPYYSTGSGTYKIAFSKTSTTPNVSVPTTTAKDLTINTWDTTGNIATAGGEQWFKFTATAATHYIHFQPGTPTNNTYYVQVFKADNTANGSSSSLYTGALRVSTSMTNGAIYYIRIWSQGATGTYSIAVNTAQTPPAIDDFTTLTTSADTLSDWADGDITKAGTDQWFKITTTGTNQRIYFRSGTLTSVYVRLYTSTGVLVDNAMTNLTNSTFSASRTVTASTEYYLRVTPYNNIGTNSGGTYKIGITFPPTEDATLTVGQWTNGNIVSATSGDQWFKFTATVATHYIHFQPGTGTGGLTDVYVQLYNADGTTTGSQTNLWGSGSSLYTSRSLTVNNVYYIRLRPYSSTSTGGTYRIGVTTSSTAPTTVAP